MNRYSGTELAGQTITVYGDTVVIRLTSDGSEQCYGFKVVDISAEYREICSHESTHWVIDSESTCTTSGSRHLECDECEEILETEQIVSQGHFCDSDTSCAICGFSVGTAHPYESDIYENWTIYREGANNISITFSEDTETEDGCDYVSIYDGNDNCIGSFSGTELAGRTITVSGDTVLIRFISDYSDGYYGFEVVDIKSSFCDHEYNNGICIFCGDGSEDYWFYERYSDSITILGCNEDISGELVIPAHIGGCPVTEIGEGAFIYENDITSIVLPETVINIGYYAFRNCENLVSVELPGGLTKIGDGAFYECLSLESITIPNGVTHIGTSAFYDTNIKSILIPDGVISIGDTAFYMSALTSIVIPDSITSIGEHAFALCHLDDVYYEGTSEDWIAIGIPESNDGFDNCRIHYSVTDIENHYEVIKTPPTCSQTGSVSKSCPCGYEFSNEIPMLDHNWVDGICSVCGTNIDDCIESSHPYENDMDESWTIYKEGAKRIAITFSEDTYTEWDCDEIFIYDSNDEVVSCCSGTQLAGKRIVVPGDTIRIRLVTDSSITEYGFKVTTIEEFYDECPHNETEIRNSYAANCCEEGYTGDTYCVECNLMLVEGEYLPADEDAHDFYYDSFDATCIDGGYERNVCSYCGYYEVISETEPTGIHDYTNGLCMHCGDVDPDNSVPVLNMGETKTATISDFGDYYYYYFTPENSGVYSFSATSEDDTYGYIYDSSFNVLISNDDEGYEYNFKVTHYLEAGKKYIFGCRYYDSEYTGSFEVSCNYEFLVAEGTTIIDNYMYIPSKNTQVSDFITASEVIDIDCLPSLETSSRDYFGTGSEFSYVDGFGNVYYYTIIVGGDVNGDSIVDALDAMHVGLVSQGHRNLDGVYALAADRNDDYIVDVIDYQAIVNQAVA